MLTSADLLQPLPQIPPENLAHDFLPNPGEVIAIRSPFSAYKNPHLLRRVSPLLLLKNTPPGRRNNSPEFIRTAAVFLRSPAR